MVITHLERATQLYQALQDYQQSTHVDYAVFEAALCHWQASPNHAPSPNDLP